MSDKRYTFDWFTPIIPIIAPSLQRYINQPTWALEIGSYEGLSTNWFLDNILTHADSHITCVDTFQGGSDLQEFALDFSQTFTNFVHNVAPYGRKVKVLQDDSMEALRQCSTNQFDFAFIDGCHEMWYVIHDAIAALRVVKSGGLLLFDDYGWGMDKVSRPGKAIDAFLELYDSKVKVLEKKYAVVVQKL